MVIYFFLENIFEVISQQSTPPSPFREISVHILTALPTTHLEAKMEQESNVIKDPHQAM
jgi:hypothetical protein